MLDADDSSAYRVSQEMTEAVDNDANAAVYSTYLHGECTWQGWKWRWFPLRAAKENRTKRKRT